MVIRTNLVNIDVPCMKFNEFCDLVKTRYAKHNKKVAIPFDIIINLG